MLLKKTYLCHPCYHFSSLLLLVGNTDDSNRDDKKYGAGRYSSVGSDVAWEKEAPRSILASGISFREDLVIKLFLRPFFLFC